VRGIVVILLFPALAVADPGARAAEQFRRADADRSGALSRAEAERGMPSLARHFDEIDADGDGHITPFEIRAWRKTRRAAHDAQTRARFDEYFRKTDTNGDGLLSREEAARGLPRVAKKFNRIDGDGDGSLSLEELHAWLDARRAARVPRVR
jgi:hypothetical protein